MAQALAVGFWLCVGLVLYSYFGYPLLVTLLARARPRRAPAASGALPSVTLLIAAYNEEACLAGKLENCLALDYPRGHLQILVAADGSGDRTAEIVESFRDRGVELSFLPQRGGKMAALTRAMARARGEIVVFSDANNAYEPDTVRRLVAPFADPRVGAVGGAKIVRGDTGGLGAAEGLYWRYESFIKEQESRLGSTIAVAGEIFAIRRALFPPVSPQVINDDFMIAMGIISQGYRVVYAAGARSVEQVSASEHDEIVRRARMVSGRFQAMALAPGYLSWRRPLVAWQVLSHKFLRPFVPLALLGALVANLAVVVWPPAGGAGAPWRLAPPYGLLLLAGQAVFYALAAGGGRLKRWGALGRVLYLPAFLVNSNYAALVGMWRHFAGQNTVLWQKAPRR